MVKSLLPSLLLLQKYSDFTHHSIFKFNQLCGSCSVQVLIIHRCLDSPLCFIGHFHRHSLAT